MEENKRRYKHLLINIALVAAIIAGVGWMMYNSVYGVLQTAYWKGMEDQRRVDYQQWKYSTTHSDEQYESLRRFCDGQQAHWLGWYQQDLAFHKSLNDIAKQGGGTVQVMPSRK
jgi:hypothetical protein